MRVRRLAALLCAIVAGLAAAGPAGAGGAAISFLIPVGNVSLPASLAGGVVGGLATDAAGNVYAGVNQAGEAFVAVFDSAGTFLRQWQVDPFVTLRDAVVLAVGPDRLVYVAPSGSGDELVRVFAADGTPVRAFGQGSGLREVTDIELDQAGSVYVPARARPDLGLPDDMIVRFDPAGNLSARLVPAPGEPGQFASALKGLAVAPDGSLYVTTRVDEGEFLHLDPAGARLPVFDPSLVIPGDRHSFEDVDLANGNLYLAGDFAEVRGRNPFGVAVLTPQGRLLDLVVGQSDEAAVAGTELYATGIHGLRTAPERTAATHIAGEFGHVRHNGVRPTDPSTSTGFAFGDDCQGSHYRDPITGITRFVLGKSSSCSVAFENYGSPCPPGTLYPTPRQAYSDGYPVGKVRLLAAGFLDRGPYVVIDIPPSDIRSGPVVVEWECDTEFGYDWKGSIDLVDPSGTIVDATSERPVERATVRLQFSLRKGGRFGSPGIAGFSPQANPQVTGRDGAFGWDVAPGFWRLRITAFGYRPFTSPVYSVPPEVTGLRLALRPDPRQQARLLDPYAGRAGQVRLGARLAQGARVAGLALRAAGGKVRGITVKAKRFRTASGIALGSSEVALRDAYTREVTAALRKAKKPPKAYRIGKATFTIKRGRVAGIVLGR
jgi:hypothetical protein